MKRLLSWMFLFAGFNATAQNAQFTIKAITSNTLQVYFKLDGSLGPVATGISNLTFVLQVPQTFSNPQGLWTVTPNSAYLGNVSTSTATSTANGSMYNTLFSWTANPNINNTTFASNTEYLLATVTTPTGVNVSNVTLIDWGNNRLDNATTGAPLWATSIAVDGVDRTNNTAIFYGNSTTAPPSNSGVTTQASTLIANGTPLSVRIVSFAGKLTDGIVMLNWLTSDEKNMDRYEVEYSSDGIAWLQVGSVTAKNEVDASYSYMHRPEFAYLHHYRLKLVEPSGAGHYSETLAFKPEQAPSEFTLFPTVVAAGAALNLVSENDEVKEIAVLDVSGKIVRSLKTSTRRTIIQTEGMASGMYSVRISSRENIRTLKFIVR
jgi:hypothetical protein